MDCHSQKYKKYTFILAYQDHLTKSVVLKTLGYEVAPSVTQSDIGSEFASHLSSLKHIWPELKIAYLNPTIDSGSVDIANMATENIRMSKTCHGSQQNYGTHLSANCYLFR
jgi:hypothetical protein